MVYVLVSFALLLGLVTGFATGFPVGVCSAYKDESCKKMKSEYEKIKDKVESEMNVKMEVK